ADALVDLARREGEESGRRLSVAEAQDIIKQAVGFKANRDEIKVSEAKLAGLPALAGADAEAAEMQRWQYYIGLVRNASLGVAAGVALLLGLLFLPPLAPGGGPGAAPAAS